MEIRFANEDDIEGIVDLLKKSLGESLMPKTERYWRWKHLENPFGPSPVLLATEGKTIIGVRAFMCWKWIHDGKILSAVRAVDTATHPNYQGKGIFRKLTLDLVNKCEKDGIDFVFNTPNKQSRPGYLKMGWQDAGRLPIQIAIHKPFSVLQSYLKRASSENSFVTDDSVKHLVAHPEFGRLIQIMNRSGIATNFSKDYVLWRYLNIPVASYMALTEIQNNKLIGFIIGRIKQTRMGREFRITDTFYDQNYSNVTLKAQLSEKKKVWGIDYATMAATDSLQSKNLFGKLGLSARVGPRVTVRRLVRSDLGAFQNFNAWSPSLGDLEIF